MKVKEGMLPLLLMMIAHKVVLTLTSPIFRNIFHYLDHPKILKY